MALHFHLRFMPAYWWSKQLQRMFDCNGFACGTWELANDLFLLCSFVIVLCLCSFNLHIFLSFRTYNCFVTQTYGELNWKWTPVHAGEIEIQIGTFAVDAVIPSRRSWLVKNKKIIIGTWMVLDFPVALSTLCLHSAEPMIPLLISILFILIPQCPLLSACTPL